MADYRSQQFWTELMSPRPGGKIAFIAGEDNIKIEPVLVSQV